jgi:hypothetical protein
MARTLPMIGVAPDELPWARLLIQLLRHPDPVVPELARQALLYVEASASKTGSPTAPWVVEKITQGIRSSEK